MNLSAIVDADATVDATADATVDATEPSLSQETPGPNVYVLPLGLTDVQRDLVELVVTLHRPSLLARLRGEDSLVKSERVPDPQYLSDVELEGLLDRNLVNIANHPYLLVEHFMPKRLLLMESHERLMNVSDKFSKFDKLLGAIGDLSIDVLVVGHSIKELDLIEAFVLGRKITYKRYSGTHLYDGTKTIKTTYESSEKKVSSKEDDYAPRVKPQPVPQQVRLHLITTHQLTSSAFTAVRPQFIVSFDALLDVKNPNLDWLRTAYTDGTTPIPLIKLLVMQSHLHGLIANEDNILEDSSIRSKTLFSSLVNRQVDNTSQFNDACGTLFQNIRKFFITPTPSNWPIQRVPEFKIYDTEQIIASVEAEYSPISIEWKNNKRLKMEQIVIPPNLTVSEYKSLLAKLTIERITLLEKDIVDNQERLKSLRISSTLKHAADDSLKLSVGEVFKGSIKTKEDAEAAEKRLERLQVEYEKFHEKEIELEKKLGALELIEKGEVKLSDEDMDKQIQQLQQVLDKLEKESIEMGSKVDDLRTEYQRSTSTAAERATKVKSVTGINAQIVAKLEGQGKKLRQLAHEEKKVKLNDEVSQMKNELNFLQVYHEKLEKTVKERGATLNVGRNGRVHRSTTPYLT